MKLNHKTRDFVEKMGFTLERLGTSPTLGRLFALLLVADRPLSLEEMGDTLHVSKASVSTNIRLCEQLGLVQRVHVPRDRRHFYEVLADSFERAVQVRLGFVHEMIELSDQGLAAIGEENHAARLRLEVMREFYEFIGEKLATNLSSWAEYKVRMRTEKAIGDS